MALRGDQVDGSIPSIVTESQDLYDLSQILPGWTKAELDALTGEEVDWILAVGRVNKQLEREQFAKTIAGVLRG